MLCILTAAWGICNSHSFLSILLKLLTKISIYFSSPDGLNMPFSDYYQVDWTQGPSVLVIGAETTGLGKTVKKLAHENKGHIVHVPMVSKLDSLSAAMAGTVIIYEAYRQVITATQAKR